MKTKNFIIIIILSIIIGIFCGFAVIGFRDLIFFFSHNINNILLFNPWLIVIFPAFGGLITGLLIFKKPNKLKGSGVETVFAAVENNNSKFKIWEVIIKAFGSAITISTGGSAGREGPIVLIGSTIGSKISEIFKLNSYQRKILLSCGAAAGISATFNTPIAGVLFAYELILRELKSKSFIPIVLSSVFASISAKMLLKLQNVNVDFIYFSPQYTLKTYWEYFFYIILAIISGFVAILYIKTLFKTEDIFNRIKIPIILKPALGGLIIGIFGIILFRFFNNPLIYGTGYETIVLLLQGKIILPLMFLLIFLKIIATSLTIGSGGYGGIFSPTLLIGALTGGTFGILLSKFFPNISAGFETYALIGMAAVFAGIGRLTLTAIVIVFEMTGNVLIIIPLMLACSISDSIRLLFLKTSIYVIKLKRMGLNIIHELEVNIFNAIHVKDIMSTNVISIKENQTYKDISNLFLKTGYKTYPVINNNNKIVGLVSITQTNKNNKKVNEFMIKKFQTITPDNSIQQIITDMKNNKFSFFPVVNSKNNLIGIVTKGDILRAYKKEY